PPSRLALLPSSLHAALPIYCLSTDRRGRGTPCKLHTRPEHSGERGHVLAAQLACDHQNQGVARENADRDDRREEPSQRRDMHSSDRKSTRLNSSHGSISYAV